MSTTGELLSVDFVHPDCDEKQMVLHIRVPIGGVTAGKVHVAWGDVDPSWRLSMLRAAAIEVVQEWYHDGNVGKVVDDLAALLNSQGAVCH